MSAKILAFPAKAEPHIAGPAECCFCGHTWTAVVPVGTAELECPSCHDNMGHLRDPVSRGGPHLGCSCGSYGFHVTLSMVYCMECGKELAR